VVATCRSANLSEELTLGKGEPVPHVRIKDLEPAQVERFLQAYEPDRNAQVWRQLQSDPALVELYRSPYYLRMLLRAMRGRTELPRNRSALFTAYVRALLNRELGRPKGAVFWTRALRDDRERVRRGGWTSDYELPEAAPLHALAIFAFALQRSRIEREQAKCGAQLAKARELLGGAETLRACLDLQVLDKAGLGAHATVPFGAPVAAGILRRACAHGAVTRRAHRQCRHGRTSNL
jgi:hypothetical protein